MLVREEMAGQAHLSPLAEVKPQKSRAANFLHNSVAKLGVLGQQVQVA